MSDYHIMTGHPTGNRYTVVFHFPVSSADNDAIPPRSYQSALVEWLGEDELGNPNTTSIVPFIDGAEQTALHAGQLYETRTEFHTNPQETMPEKLARLDTLFASRLITEQAEIQEILRYWGHGRDVP
jgi:hypothetical protein